MSLTNTLLGAALLVVQILAALPWVAAAFGEGRSFSEFYLSFFQKRNSTGQMTTSVLAILATLAGLVIGVLVLPAVFLYSVEGREGLEVSGRGYGAVLQLQLVFDFFVVFITVMLRLWPKGGAIALSAFREGVRQPMYWLLASAAF